MTAPHRPRRDGIDLRLALILISSLLVGLIAGLLTFVAGSPWALAVISGGAAFGASCFFFDWLIKPFDPDA